MLRNLNHRNICDNEHIAKNEEFALKYAYKATRPSDPLLYGIQLPPSSSQWSFKSYLDTEGFGDFFFLLTQQYQNIGCLVP